MELVGRVAVVTGGHRGIGSACVTRLAELGADVIALDIGAAISSVPAPLATDDDLAITKRHVEVTGRRLLALTADVRDADALATAIARGVDEFGRLDIVVANAGIFPVAFEGADEQRSWQDAIDVNLTGVWNTIRATVPHIVAGEHGGSIIIMNSTAGLRGLSDGWAGYDGYVAAKHGTVGLMRSYANILGPQSIRVNTVHPSGVSTSIVDNADYAARRKNPSEYPANLLPVAKMEPRDIANAVAWLASDEARYITGVEFPVDAGFNARR
ncbi:MAG TPA: mycofactocin-coupled SDR family oxidoreductase [Mycobacterium sp.]